MKTFKTLFLITLFFTVSANAQLDKQNWLVGGTGSFNSFTRLSSFTYNLNNFSGNSVIQSKIKQLEISPKIGYFIIDKLAVGLVFSIEREIEDDPITITGQFGGGRGDNSNYAFGPFVRYYFLKKDKDFNLLLEANYQLGNTFSLTEKGKINQLNFLVGPEIFFNNFVGLEVLVGYKIKNRNFDNPGLFSFEDRGFQIAVGLQIHLQKK